MDLMKHNNPDIVITMTMAKGKKTSGETMALTTDGVQGMQKYER